MAEPGAPHGGAGKQRAAPARQPVLLKDQCRISLNLSLVVCVESTQDFFLPFLNCFMISPRSNQVTFVERTFEGFGSLELVLAAAVRLK